MTNLDALLTSGGPESSPDVAPDSGGGPFEEVPIETMYDILRNRRRRLVIHYLVNAADHDAVLGTLATQVAAWEHDKPVSAIDSTLRKRTYNTLQQSHLPKMDEAGLVEYDRNRGTISLAVDPNRLEFYLTALPKLGSSWTVGFLLSGVLLWLMLAANWVAVHVLRLYKPGQTWVLTGFALLLVGVGIVHVYRSLF